MAEHNDLGRLGEDLAAAYLAERGYNIICRNWRHRHKEVDIVAMDGDVLVFVEVKTRSAAMAPSDLVSFAKVRYLETAAEAYIRQSNFRGDARFDLVVLTRKAGGFDILLIPSAFR